MASGLCLALLISAILYLATAQGNGEHQSLLRARHQEQVGKRLERMSAMKLELNGGANSNAEVKMPTAEIDFTHTQRKRPLRIAQIAPMHESVPPKMYGGTERIVYYLVEELVRQGHNVTLFASYDSKTSAKLVSDPFWPSLRLHPNDHMLAHIWLMKQVYKHAHEFDVIHGHIEPFFFLLDLFPDKGVFATLHGILNLTVYTPYFSAFPNIPLISISNDQQTHLIKKDVGNFVGTVHHGIPKNLLKLTRTPKGNYLAFLGRITEAKRPDLAIEIAVRTGIPLKMAAKIDNVDKTYWEREIQPLVERHSDLVQFIGEITEDEKSDFLGNARAMLFPIDWIEPFGLVMIESMACGTPVIARRNGSVPEVVDHGVTGFIFDTVDEAVAAVQRVPELNRTQIRRVFERRFTAERMAKDYLRLYRQSLEERERNGLKKEQEEMVEEMPKKLIGVPPPLPFQSS